jgi:hypothetical protein
MAHRSSKKKSINIFSMSLQTIPKKSLNYLTLMHSIDKISGDEEFVNQKIMPGENLIEGWCANIDVICINTDRMWRSP